MKCILDEGRVVIEKDELISRKIMIHKNGLKLEGEIHFGV